SADLLPVRPCLRHFTAGTGAKRISFSSLCSSKASGPRRGRSGNLPNDPHRASEAVKKGGEHGGPSLLTIPTSQIWEPPMNGGEQSSSSHPSSRRQTYSATPKRPVCR